MLCLVVDKLNQQFKIAQFMFSKLTKDFMSESHINTKTKHEKRE